MVSKTPHLKGIAKPKNFKAMQNMGIKSKIIADANFNLAGTPRL